jgi:hypothetical protein
MVSVGGVVADDDGETLRHYDAGSNDEVGHPADDVVRAGGEDGQDHARTA